MATGIQFAQCVKIYVSLGDRFAIEKAQEQRPFLVGKKKKNRDMPIFHQGSGPFLRKFQLCTLKGE